MILLYPHNLKEKTQIQLTTVISAGNLLELDTLKEKIKKKQVDYIEMLDPDVNALIF